MEDYSTNFSNLLQRNNDLSIHHRNIQCLMIEIFKIKNNLAPPIMTTMFTERENHYNLRHFQEFVTKRKRTTRYGLETLSYRSPKLWTMLQEKLKNLTSLNLSKSNIKQWICNECPCRLCRQYIPNLGFI